MSREGAEFAALFRRGTKLLHQGRAKEAARLLERAHRLDAAHVDAAVNLSGAYILSRQFRKAVAVLEWLREQVPDNSAVWTNLGAAYLGNPVLAGPEQQEKAIAAFAKALDINPVAPSVAYNIGLIYRDRQEIDRAIHWFKRAIQANPHDQDARNILRRLSSGQ